MNSKVSLSDSTELPDLQSSQLPSEGGFTLSRPEDRANSEVYGPPSTVPSASSPTRVGPLSATGLSSTFPGCNVRERDVTDREFGASSQPVTRRDLLSEAVRGMAGDTSAGGGEDMEEEERLEDAQRLSQDPELLLSDPRGYVDGHKIVMDGANPGKFNLVRCDSRPSSLSSSRRREEMELLESESGSVAPPPPNQRALIPSGPSVRFSENNDSPGPHKRFRVGQERPFSLHAATIVGPPPGPLAVRITSAIGRVNYAPILDLTKNGEAGFFPHDFPWEDPDLVVDPDPAPSVLDENRFVAVKELSSSSTLRTVVKNEMISFLLIVRDPEDTLYIPSTTFFDSVVNKMEITILTKFPHLRSLFWSSSKWMGCGILEISNEDGLEEWRVVLSSLILDGVLVADTFPKDSLLMGPDVTALLKDPYLSYKIKWMSHCLVYRNKQLLGNVRVACSKQYGPHDITRHDINIDGWQMIYLAGDCVFMESLSRSPVTHRFHVGPSSVILRGGIRKPAFLADQSRAQFTWFRSDSKFAPSSLQPIRELAPASEDPALLSRSSSASSGIGDSIAADIPGTSGTAGKRKTGRKSAAQVASCQAPSCTTTPSVPTQKKAVARPMNRSARLKAKAARNKSCC